MSSTATMKGMTMFMKTIKRTAMMVLCLVCCLPLVGCRDPAAYYGPYVSSYSVASNSLLGLVKIATEESRIVQVEKDEYGRELFIFWGYSSAADRNDQGFSNVYALLISQKSDEKYVYYYPDYNFIVRQDEYYDGHYPMTDGDILDGASNTFSSDEIDALKAKNDWGLLIDESKCIRAEISRKARDTREKLVSDKLLSDVYNRTANAFTSRGHNYLHYLTSDEYDRHIYFFGVLGTPYVAIIFPNGSYKVTQIFDLWDYQDELKAFKDENNWNLPFP